MADQSLRFRVRSAVFWILMVGYAGESKGQLGFSFYANVCPAAENLVFNAVRSASLLDNTIPPKLLRLMFHDCFVEGCDGSILLDSTANNTAEKDDGANKSVDGFAVIDSAKNTLELLCPGVVSCADIIVLAARDAVILMGGPQIQVPTGRRDGRSSRATNVRTNLPDTTFNLDALNRFFSAKGLSQLDMIILSGAHTIGLAHCNAFNERFQFNPNGSVKVDPSINPIYAKQLLQRCPANPSPTTTVAIDPTTPNFFDNVFYSNLKFGKGLFGSDQVLFTDPRSRPTVESLSRDFKSFLSGWSNSFLKLSTVQIKTGSAGEIRRRCRSVN